MRRKERKNLWNMWNELKVVRIEIIERKLKEDLIIKREELGKGFKKRLRMDEEIGIERGCERKMKEIVNKDLIDMDDGREFRKGEGKWVRIVVVRVRGCKVKMVDIGNNKNGDRNVRGGEKIMKINELGNSIEKLEKDDNRIKEKIVEERKWRMLGKIGKEVDGDIDKLLEERRIIEIIIGEDWKMSKEGIEEKIEDNIGKGIEKVKIIEEKVKVGMEKMVEEEIGEGNEGGEEEEGEMKGNVNVEGEEEDGRGMKDWIDEIMGKMEVKKEKVEGKSLDKVVRIGKEVEKRIGVERKSKGNIVIKKIDWSCRKIKRKRRVRIR